MKQMVNETNLLVKTYRIFQCRKAEQVPQEEALSKSSVSLLLDCKFYIKVRKSTKWEERCLIKCRMINRTKENFLFY